MQKKIIKTVSILLVFCIAFSALTMVASALSWDGSSSGGNGGGTAAAKNGYSVRNTGDNCIGYRFSVVDKNGANKVAKVIDVFRNTSYGNSQYSSGYKFTVKYNKKQIINNQNSGFTTSRNSTNCYKETDMGFATGLPAPSGMGTWQNNATNLNRVLSALGVGSISNLKNGDKVLVEPIFDVKLESVYHAVTESEIAIYGKYILGANSNGGSSGNPQSWGFISEYVNKLYPNSLYTPDGQGLWTGVGASSSRITFYNIINKGYGVGIAYTETKPDFSPSLRVNVCEAWPGNKSVRNNNHYGISSGNTFENYTYGHGYPKSGDKVWFAINFPQESENCYVRQSVWIEGGGSTSRNVWSNSNTWYDVQLSPDTVDDNRSAYIVKARVDWIDSNGNVKKWGAEKTFYIPIKPILTRFQVSAYNISGEIQAYDNIYGQSGAVYVGQRINQRYHFTAQNKWTSYHYLRATTYVWDNSKGWIMQYKNAALGDADLYDDWVGISNSSPYATYSRQGEYRVPDNSANTNGENRIPIRVWTHWCSDIPHTTEEKWFNIPIVKADAEMSDIILADSDGNVVDETSLEVGDEITVYYKYKNNTNCKIYVNGFNNDKSQISGIYAIDANSEITVRGYSFTVPNKREFSIWGGVYLEGAGIYNTSWESNGNNNQMTLDCKVNHPVKLIPITPNAPYREGTQVITSYHVKNISDDDYLYNDNITVRFKVYNRNGRVIKTITKNHVIAPGKKSNIVYFKWVVPEGINPKNVVVMADLKEANKSSTWYNRKTNIYNTVSYDCYTTPDTDYEDKAPDGFEVPQTPEPSSKYVAWREYLPDPNNINGYISKQYAIGLIGSNNETLTPAENSHAEKNGSKWVMKSGYGVWLDVNDTLARLRSYEFPNASAYTRMQYVTATFPEFGYASGNNLSKTLYKDKQYYIWNFNRLDGKQGDKIYHYTPIYYPNGDYTVSVIKSDMWTPCGMLTAVSNTNAIEINGNAYDDWYVGRK